MSDRPATRSDFDVALGRRLRAVRTEHGYSVSDVESRSGGRWKTATTASYERGSRSVTVRCLAELAEFYGRDTADLLPRPSVLIAMQIRGGQ